MNKRKMLILDDNVSLLNKLQINIRRYDVVPAATLDEAMQLLTKEDVSFIVADIRLNFAQRGYHIFDQLFSKGKSVPGIVFTAFEIGATMRNELDEIGVLKTVKKVGKNLASQIEDAADAILDDHEQRLSPVTAKIKRLGLEDQILEYADPPKKIKDWLACIFANKYSIGKEKILKDLLIRQCNVHLLPEGSRPSPFPQLGSLD